MFRSRRPNDPSAAATKSSSKPFWKTESNAAPLSSDAETIKFHKSSSSTTPGAAHASRHHQTQSQPVPVPVPAAPSAASRAATHQKQNSSSSYSAIKSGVVQHDPRNAVYTTPRRSDQQQHQQEAQYSASQLSKPSHSSSTKPVAAVSGPTSHAHRVSVQSLDSLNTASSASRSSFGHVSIDNLTHSWDSNTLSTAPSSTYPQSTENLGRIPVSESARDRDGPQSPLEPSIAASRRFPLIESDGQKGTSSHGFAAAAGEQASNALPLPNSEYEAAAGIARSLRRTKTHIVSSGASASANVPTPSLRAATSTAGRASPTPQSSLNPIAPPAKPQDHRRTKSETPASVTDVTANMAYQLRTRTEQHVSGHQLAQTHLLARVLATSSKSTRHSQTSSTASTRTIPTTMHQPRVASSTQSANPNMDKLKETVIPRISSNNGVPASPMDSRVRQFTSSMQSPRHTSAEGTSTSWSTAKSPDMTSVRHAYSSLTSAAVMSPAPLSSVASPRTLVSGSHHPADALPPIFPSQQLHHAASTVSRTSVYTPVDEGRDSTPSSPGSHTVRTLFSSLTSRQQHRHSTPAPQQRPSALSNPPIIAPAQEVASPRLMAAAAGILSPPPLPPQSTRPDAPQQEWVQHDRYQQPPTSPRHATSQADFVKTRTAMGSHQDSAKAAAGLRSPSPTQTSTLRSYGLDSGNPPNPSSPMSSSGAGLRNLLHSPYGTPSRTLMSDSEVTTVTTVSVTRSTVVSQATATASMPHPLPLERRSSSSQRRGSVNSQTTKNLVQQQQSAGYPSHLPQSSLQQQQPTGGFLGMFRPKSPRPFPMMERSSSPAPPVPQPSKTPPPRAATASPRRFPFSLPLNFRHKPKKSISGASVEAVIGGTLGMAGEGAMSSRGSLERRGTPDLMYSEYQGNGDGKHYHPASTAMMTSPRRGKHNGSVVNDEDTQDEGDIYGNEDGSDDMLMQTRMQAVHDWSHTTEQNWQLSGKSRKPRPGVSFDLPASESERDDTGMTAVSVAPGAGRVLRMRGKQFSETRQFSDNESFVY